MEETIARLSRDNPSPPTRKVTVADLVALLDHRPPRGINLDDKCECGHCSDTVARELEEDLFADDAEVFEKAMRSGRSRREALLVLRDHLLRLPQARALLADRGVSRRSIVAGANARAASVALRICFPKPPPQQPRCGSPRRVAA